MENFYLNAYVRDNQTARRLLLALLLLCTGLLYTYKIDNFGLFDVDEAIYSECVREMVQTGDYIVPRFNYAYYNHKPPLHYWAMALSFKVFGANSFAARFPSGVYTVLLLLLVYKITESLFNGKTAFLAALVLAFNIGILIFSKAALLDTHLAFLVTAALYCFLKGYTKKKPVYYYLMYAFIALGMMTKGPIGVILPVSAAGSFYLLNRDTIRIKEMRPLFGIFLFILICLPWYGLVTYLTDGAFFREFFIRHNFQRFFSSVDRHSGGTGLVYLPMLMIELFPWSAFLPLALYKAFREHRRNRNVQFVLLWAVIPLLIIAFAGTRLPNYLAPVLPAFAILIAYYLDSFTFEQNGRGGRIIAAVHGVIAGGIGIFFLSVDWFIYLLKHKFLDTKAYANYYLMESFRFGATTKLLGLIFLANLAAVLLGLRLKSKKIILGAGLVFLLGFEYVLMNSLGPRIWEYTLGELDRVSRFAGRQADPGDTIILYGLDQPSVNFYLKRKVILLQKGKKTDYDRALRLARKSTLQPSIYRQTYLIMPKVLTHDFLVTGEFISLYSAGSFALIKNAKAR